MMKNKSLGFSVLGILTLLTLLSFASATITFTNVPTLSRDGNSATVTITSTDNGTVAFTTPTPVITANGKTITFNLTSLVISDAVPTPHTITINYVVPNESQFTFGTNYSTTLTATMGASTAPLTLSFENIPSEYPNLGGNLVVSIDSLSDDGFGDDTSWFALDSITAKISVENNGPEKIKSISVSYGLYDTQHNKWIFKDKASSFSLNDGDDKTVTADFKLTQLSKFDADNTGDYKFYAWATGEDEEFDSQKTSVTTSEDIEMQFESDFVTLDNIQVLNSDSTIGCGQDVQLTADVVNVGSDDQNNVYVQLVNTPLGINKKVEIGDIDSLEKSTLDFTFTVPEDVTEGTYQIQLAVYNENDEGYTTEFGNDDAVFKLPISVSGSCSTVVPVAVVANLETAAKAGEEFSIKATITNTASTRKTFTLELSDYDAWSTLVNVDKTSLVLDAGKSTDVLIKLKANEDVSGSKNFNIVMKEGAKVFTQPVSVSVQGVGGFNITGLFSGLGLGGNAYLWVIGALNVLLVLIIIIVAVRVIRKK
jgi:hypothetical protein